MDFRYRNIRSILIQIRKQSFFLEQININEHLFIQSGPTSELAENRAALKLLLLLVITTIVITSFRFTIG